MTMTDSLPLFESNAERDFADKLREALENDPDLLALVADEGRTGLEVELVTHTQRPHLWRYILVSGGGLMRSDILGPKPHTPHSATVEQLTQAWFSQPRNGDPYELFLKKVHASGDMRKVRGERFDLTWWLGMATIALGVTAFIYFLRPDVWDQAVTFVAAHIP